MTASGRRQLSHVEFQDYVEPAASGASMPRFVRLLMPVVVAVVLGPLIAGLAVSIFAIASNLFDQTGSLPAVDLLKMCVFYIVFAYIWGGAIALLAGILVSIWMMSRPPSLTVVVAAALIATAIYLGLAAFGAFGSIEAANARGNVVLMFPLAVIAAVGCWLLTRRFALRQQPPAI